MIKHLTSLFVLAILINPIYSQSAGIRTIHDIGTELSPSGYYNYNASTYNTTGGLRIITSSFTDNTTYVIKYQINAGTKTQLTTGTHSGTSMNIDIQHSSLPSLSNADKIIFYITNDAFGTNTEVTAQADDDGYKFVSSSAGDADYFYYDVTVPTVSNVTSDDANATKIIDETVDVKITFSEIVDVVTSGGTPSLTLETGSSDATASYNSGSNSANLVFRYTVASGNSSNDLDYNSTSALATNGGTIRDKAGNDATLTLATPGQAGSLGANKAFVIDGVKPTVSSITPPSDGSYKEGENLDFTVNYSEAVTVVTTGGTPTLSLTVGVTSVNVSYISGSGSTSLIFRYTVADGHNDTDGISMTSPIVLNSGTMKDANGNDASLTYTPPTTSGILVDDTAPTVSSVSSSKTDGSYKAGNMIPITVTFSETVTVTGTPQFTLETGASDAVVDYTSGSGSTVLTFEYTVASGNTSSDLDYSGTGSLALNAGTILDAAGNAAVLTLASPGQANSLGANKALIIDTTAPTVSTVSSSSPNATYKIDDVIPIKITFSEKVTVTGTPQLVLSTGSFNTGVTYSSGSGTTDLTFNYTVSDGHSSSDLDYVSSSALSGTIKDAAGNDATLTLATPGAANSLGSNKDFEVDGIRPTVSSVTSTKANGSYKVGDQIDVTITFDDNVTVTGSPQLTLKTGTSDAVVNYSSGSGGATLMFTYTIGAGETSSDLAYQSTSSLALNSGTIKDASGNAATLTLPTPGATNSLSANKALIIDTTTPTISSVSSTKDNGSYTTGEVIAITVTFSEDVTVSGTPTLTLETSSSDEVVNYSSGSGSDVLTFNYTVASGNTSSDLDYQSTTALIQGTSIQDAAGNDADLTLATPGAANSLGANKDLIIDTTVPTVSSVSSTKDNGSYKEGNIIAVTVTFSESVTVTGTPQITLETGSSDAVVDYTSGSGTSILTFNYTVAAGHTSSDLDYQATSSLGLNGGTIADAAANAATLTLVTPGQPNSLGANKDLIIDTTVPTVSSVSSTKSDGSYIIADVIPITITFSEAVTVTGTPQITLETGSSDAAVDYSSGSGTTILTFNYTIATDQSSSDLDYVGTTSLGLNGGTIKDAAGNTATLTLATPGQTNSLGASKALVVDGVIPTVSSVSSTSADGSNKAGDVIPVTITFSEAVVVTGSPQLTLETGDTDATVDYSSGTGTTVLTFNYTIGSGHTSSDLDYKATTSLALNGGTIKDAAGNDATLTLPTVNSTNSLSGNKDLIVDTTDPAVASVSSTTDDGSYMAGDVIAVTITFSEVVTVTGTPQLTLETGTSDAVVNYSSGTGSTVLTFNFTVAAGETNSDLDYVATTSLVLNGGTIQDAAGNNATLTLASPGAANSLGANKTLIIDTTDPTVSSVTSTSDDGSYKTGDIIPVTITFSEAITVTGTPQTTLETGTSDAVVDYSSGSGSTVLTFNYTVAAGNTSSDLDYVTTTSLALNGGTIQDAAGNNATLTLASPGSANSLGANKALVIDTTVPTVSSVSSTTVDGSYKAGDAISVTVTFSEAVTVTGTPQITLETGDADATVDYSSGTGSTVLTFNYTVAAWETSSDLDYVGTTSLGLNGGTIRDAVGNDATLTLATPGQTNSLGDAKALIIDTTDPTVSSVSSTTVDGSYKAGDVISVTVTFSEAVTVTGTPQITLETGDADATVDYSSGSASTVLTFNYTVAAGHTSSDLDYVATTSLALNGGTITDVAGNDATLTLPTANSTNSLSGNKDLIVDTTDPTVSSVSSTSDNGSYKAGDVIPVTVSFDEAVTVTGTPQITLETGSSDATVDYTSGSGTSTLTFNYTVVSGHTSSDLDYTTTTSLVLNAGTIEDAAGNAAVLTLATPGQSNSLGDSKDLIIDTTIPSVSSVSSTVADGSYKAGDVIPITITFSEVMTVTGTPQLTLETGTSDAVVDYSSGAGSTVLTFNYTVASGNTSSDLDYVATTSLALNGGAITDAAGNNATLTLASPGAANSLGANKALVIDTTVPTVSSVSSTTADGSYKAGDVISVTVTFSEAVTVTGTPQLNLETGDADATVDYSSGSGSTVLTFSYTVAAGQSSSDLDYVATTSLVLDGGTIQDAAGNDATLTLAIPGQTNSLGDAKALIIDTTNPTVSSVSSSKTDGSYKAGVIIPITITFSEVVTVTGTPQLNLETGDADATVDYSSGSDSTVLTFNYTVAAGHTSSDLDYVATTSLALNGGTITDAAGNSATLTLPTVNSTNSLSGNKDLIVDTTDPTVSSVSSTSDNGSYKAGDVIPVTVTFDEAVTVTGTPQITLETGSSDATVDYTSGSGTSTLTFNYTVVSGHTNSDLDYAATTSLALNGGSIVDLAGNDAVLTLTAAGTANSLGANKAIIIDTEAPTVSFVSSTNDDGNYILNDVIAVVIDFSEDVIVSGTPQLTLETGDTDPHVDYTSGSGNDSLVFNYTVATGHISSDLDYVTITALALNGGAITDLAGNNATLTLDLPGAGNSMSAYKELVIDGVIPTILSVSSSSTNKAYTINDNILVHIEVSENVVVTGTPNLTLETGTSDALIDYTSGSGNDTLTFTYTVAQTHASSDLDYGSTSALNLNGGTLRDVAGNNLVLTLPATGAAGSLSANNAIVIDTDAPACSLSYTDSLVRFEDNTVIITATFTDSMNVSNNPTISVDFPGTNLDVTDANMLMTSGNLWTYNLALIDDVDGTVTITITGEDKASNTLAGNAVAGTQVLRIDNTIPQFSDVLPDTGSFVNHTQVAYTISDNTPILDSAHIEWDPYPSQLNTIITPLIGTELEVTSHALGTLTNDPQLVDGTLYEITFFGQDSAGNTISTIVDSVTYDTTAPTVALTYSKYIASADTVVTITAQFDENVIDPQIAIDYAGVGDDVSATNMTIDANSTIWTFANIIPPGEGNNGIASVTITTTDLATNALRSSYITNSDTLLVDNTVPTITFSYENLTQPILSNEGKNGEIVEITAQFSERADAGNPPVLNIEYADSTSDSFMNMSAYNSSNNDSVWIYRVTLPDSSKNDGIFTANLTAKDLAGNPVITFDNSQAFTVDNTPPADFVTDSVFTYGNNPVLGWINGTTDTVQVMLTLPSLSADPSIYSGGRVDIQMNNINRSGGWLTIDSSDSISTGGLQAFYRGITAIKTKFVPNINLMQGDSLLTRAMITDRVGNKTNGDSSTTILVYDPFAPTLGAVTGGIFFTKDTVVSSDSLSATWSTFSDSVSQSNPGSGLSFYEYKIQHYDAGGTYDDDLKAWTTIGTSETVTHTDLALTHDNLYSFHVRATDVAGNISEIMNSDTIRRINSAPEITAVTDTLQSFEDILFSQTIEFTDADTATLLRDNFIYNLKSTYQYGNIQGDTAKFLTDSNVINWTPAQEDTGLYSFRVIIQDNWNFADTIFYDLFVNAVNDTPTVTGINDQSMQEDQTEISNFKLSTFGNDVDNDSTELTWQVAVIDTSRKPGFPTSAALFFGNGTPEIVKQRLIDQYQPQQRDKLNKPLKESKGKSNEIQSVNSTNVHYRNYLANYIQVALTDTNGIWWATFNVDSNYYGADHRIIFYVSDPDGATSQDTMLLTILPENDPPVIDSIPRFEVTENQFLELDFADYVTDVDDTTLTVRVSALTYNNKMALTSTNVGATNVGDSLQYLISDFGDTVIFTPEIEWSDTSLIQVSVIDGQNARASKTFVIDIIRVPRPNLSLEVIQNNAFTNFFEVVITDTISKTDSLFITVQGQPILLDTVAAYTYVGHYSFDNSGTYAFYAKAWGVVGDTTITRQVFMAQAKAYYDWTGYSPDGNFRVFGTSGAVPFDQGLLIVDSTMFNEHFNDRASYRLGKESKRFEIPVEVSFSSMSDIFAIYQRENGVEWVELPSVTKGGQIIAYTDGMGYFRLGPKTIIVPGETSLHQNYPNPFNPVTNIIYDVGFNEGPRQKVNVIVYNLLGQYVATLVNEYKDIGRYTARWDGKDQYGIPVSSGIYFVRMMTNQGRISTKKMMLIR